MEQLRVLDCSVTYDYEKHRLDLSHKALSSTAYLRLPITQAYHESIGVEAAEVNYLMLLVQTGSAAIGIFRGGECLSHKVLTAYMVRKKQGKSQLKYLKTKGKSRAGSRVRLAKTLEFFENINTRLQQHFEEQEFDRIAFSCSKILVPHLFGSKIATPFDKKDPSIYRIPRHLHQPNYEVLLSMQRYLQKAELVFEEKDRGIFEALVAESES